MSAEGSRRAILAAACANLGIAATKFVAWGLTGASSMLAEAIHSTADTGNQLLLVIGGRAAKRQADESHPFGYGRARYLAAFMVAIVMFSLGGLFALYECYQKIVAVRAGEHDELSDSTWWWVPLVVILISLIAESLSLRTALQETHKARAHLSVIQFIRQSKAPELPVVMLEDCAAVLGLVFALLGIGLTLLTGNDIFDALGSGFIGVLLVVVAIVLAREMLSLLEGESASPENQQAIRDALTGTDGVAQVIHMRTVHLGPETILLAAKIAVDPEESAGEVARIIDAAEQRVRSAVPTVGPSFLEPDVLREITAETAEKEN
ncbi:cation diffusion facilitator family transporter [Acidipropionibacterium jensenii]|uniref:cation diffusion facilitator family transporter n=1 Tax=Acidipropionibacterium jensenii TaxID=1749 RepID=UPI00214B9018